MDLKDIERIKNDNNANDSMNLQPKLHLNYMGSVNRDWLVKTRKKTSKDIVHSQTKQDHIRFVKQIDKSLELSNNTKAKK